MQKIDAYMGRIDKQTADLQEDRFREVGTPAELGARARGRALRENAAYLASLPGQMKDPGLMGINEDASRKYDRPAAFTNVPTNRHNRGCHNLVKQAEQNFRCRKDCV